MVKKSYAWREQNETCNISIHFPPAATDALCTVPRLDLSLCCFYVIFLCFASGRETIYSVWGAHEEKRICSEILFKFVCSIIVSAARDLEARFAFFLGISISFLLTLNPIDRCTTFLSFAIFLLMLCIKSIISFMFRCTLDRYWDVECVCCKPLLTMFPQFNSGCAFSDPGNRESL